MDSTGRGNRPRSVAVVGCGYWGVNYVRLLGEMPGVKTVYAVEKSEARLAEIAGRFPRAKTATSIEAVLDRIDAAIVATPAGTHRAVAGQLIEAGVDVLIEKPMATTSLDAMALSDLAESRGVTLAVGHTFLYHDAVTAMKGYFDESSFGVPYYMYSQRTNLGPIRQDVDALWDLAPHDISIFNFLLGAEPVVVSAIGHRALGTPSFDSGFITMTYPGEVIAHIHVSWADPAKVRQLVAVGSGRRIVFDDLNPNERIRVFEKGVAQSLDTDSFGRHQLDIRDGDIFSPKIGTSEPLRNQVEDFFEAIDGARAPRSDARTGLGVVRVMEAVQRSVARRGAPVLVEGGEVHHREEGIVVDLTIPARVPASAVSR